MSFLLGSLAAIWRGGAEGTLVVYLKIGNDLLVLRLRCSLPNGLQLLRELALEELGWVGGAGFLHRQVPSIEGHSFGQSVLATHGLAPLVQSRGESTEAG